MNRDLILAQAHTLRMAADVLIAMLEGEVPEKSCQHPEEKRLDTSTAGQPPTFFCQVCEKEVVGQV